MPGPRFSNRPLTLREYLWMLAGPDETKTMFQRVEAMMLFLQSRSIDPEWDVWGEDSTKLGDLVQEANDAISAGWAADGILKDLSDTQDGDKT